MNSTPNMAVYMKPKIQDDTNNKKSKNKKKNRNNLDPENSQTPHEFPTTSFSGRDHRKIVKGASSSALKDLIVSHREPCYCEASIHDLVNNCLNCGRIVCGQEGNGPCLTCGKLVCSEEIRQKLVENTQESEFLYYQLMFTYGDEGLENQSDLKTYLMEESEDYEANALKDRLLQFDQESAKRTHIIDDNSDYFNVNKWMTKDERKYVSNKMDTIQAKKHMSRLDQKFQINLATGIIEKMKVDIDIEKEAQDPIIQGALYGNKDAPAAEPIVEEKNYSDHDFPELEYIPQDWQFNASKKEIKGPESFKAIQIQDKELMEHCDEGMVLTLQQPWASLLVAGIKLHEGRNWYTSYRGTLWIHAGGKPVTQSSIDEQEKFFRRIYKDKDVIFPQTYPTGVLLGCITLAECFSQDEYLKEFPYGYSESPYVFICENPIPLKVKIPMKGSPKIYELDKKIHSMARKYIQN